ncbi:MAG: 50S ribosomal protein L22 [Solirubrobacteraceae bacterium]|nr:50S ribosomal protein L22 [Solirubrobacteraceae bacterium]
MADETTEPNEPETKQDPVAADEGQAAKAAPAAKKAAAKKPAAKKAAAKKAPAKKAAAAKADDADAVAAEAEATAAATPASKKAAAKKPAAKKAAAKKAAAKADEAPAKAAPRPRPTRSRRDKPAEQITVRAQAKYIRSSARKARLVCDHIRETDVIKARAILEHSPRAVARDWSKLLESAVANAEHNHALDAEDLKIVAVYADEGPTLKRFQPRAQGRAFRIRKRTSHLTILLGSKE